MAVVVVVVVDVNSVSYAGASWGDSSRNSS